METVPSSPHLTFTFTHERTQGRVLFLIPEWGRPLRWKEEKISPHDQLAEGGFSELSMGAGD